MIQRQAEDLLVIRRSEAEETARLVIGKEDFNAIRYILI